MADMSQDAGSWWDTLRVWITGGGPAALVGGIVAFYWRAAGRRDKRTEETRSADVAERARVDAAEALLIERMNAEIARKDTERAAELAACRRWGNWWMNNSRFGWAGADAARDGWSTTKHAAENREQRLISEAFRKGVELTVPEPYPDVPSIEVLTGRNGKEEPMPP